MSRPVLWRIVSCRNSAPTVFGRAVGTGSLGCPGGREARLAVGGRDRGFHDAPIRFLLSPSVPVALLCLAVARAARAHCPVQLSFLRLGQSAVGTSDVRQLWG